MYRLIWSSPFQGFVIGQEFAGVQLNLHKAATLGVPASGRFMEVTQ